MAQQEKPERKRRYAPMDGNQAAAHIAYAFSDVAIIYPITPSSPMGELADAWSAANRKNLMGRPVEVTEMQSEAGAAGAVHGSLNAGCMTTTFTASQGLLLMIPNMFKISGELLPCVFHVAARALAGQALSIFGDHTDVMAVRQTGWALMCSGSPQEAMDLALVSHIATLKCRVPFLHFFDGFRTSHEIQKVSVIPDSDLSAVIKSLADEIRAFRARSINPEHPNIRGTAQGTDIYFQCVEAGNKYYDAVTEHVIAAMELVEKTTGRAYRLFEYTGHPEAEQVVILMGSGSDTVKEAVDYLVSKGKKVGVVVVRLFRPFSTKHFMETLPSTVKRIAVLDRTKEATAPGEPLYTDVSACMHWYHKGDVLVVGGRYALGSKEFAPVHALSVFENLAQPEPKNPFTVNINDDVTHLSLPVPNVVLNTLPEGTVQCVFYGLSSDGTVGANKEACKIIADNSDLFTQAYFAYDAHKSGGLTASHLRFGPTPITGHYLIENADYVACHRDTYVTKFTERLISHLKEGGTFVLNCKWADEEMDKYIPEALRRAIAQNHVKFYRIDATQLAHDLGLGHHINMIMQTVFFRLSGVLPVTQAIDMLKKAIAKTYHKKGPEVVRMNQEAVDLTLDALKPVYYFSSWANLPEKIVHTGFNDLGENIPEFVSSVMVPVTLGQGDHLAVSKFEPGGVIPLGTTKYERRTIASEIPEWDMERCTQCNYCSLTCPHAAIRPFLVDEHDVKRAPESFETATTSGGRKLAEFKYRIQVSPFDCTGCQLCTQICPDDALHMRPIAERIDVEATNWKFASELPLHPDVFEKYSVKGSQFQKPLLEFNGACAGCGETPYVKLVTQLYGDQMVIANATGCSSIWGASAPWSPYTVNEKGHGPAWANSLFEDNAEYGMGICIAITKRREALREHVIEALTDEDLNADLRDALTVWSKNYANREVCAGASERIKNILGEEEARTSPVLQEIWYQRDLLEKKSFWIVGGDGWAYDIGFGGVDHVIAQGLDVNILVLDTEAYSNTGGQRSKATPRGSVAKFAVKGKETQKKDLGMMAMAYGDVYVASVSLGANMTQLLKAITEAESYTGTSLMIAYAPCIEHGIRKGMESALYEQKLGVQLGYWPLYRYNPRLIKEGKNPFLLDSKEPKGDMAVLLGAENRFLSLTRSYPVEAETKHHKLEKDIQRRWRKYKRIAYDVEEAMVRRSRRESTVGKKPMLVLYGSQTGNSEDVAKRIAGEARGFGFQVHLSELDDYDTNSLQQEPLIIMVCSTFGQGEFPDNAVNFWAWLKESDLPADYLKKTRFAIFGLGDSTYCYFNEASKLLEQRMKEVGAEQIIARGEGDDMDPEKFDTKLEPWTEELWEVLGTIFPMAGGATEIAPEAHYTILTTKTRELASTGPPGTLRMRLLCNERITSPNHDRDVRHVVLDLRGTGFRFQCGDSLGIVPRNKTSDVLEFIQFYGKADPARWVKITPSSGSPPLKVPKKVLVQELFEQYLDIFGKPSRRFFAQLAAFATDEAEKKKLKYLGSPAGKAAARKYFDESVTFADIMREFPSSKPDLEFLVEMIPIIKPRFYSIASSQNAHPDVMQLCIVINDWETASGRYRIGLCTGYLQDLDPKRDEVYVHCFIKSGAFEIPPNPKKPLIMASLGTGLAPFRAFLQEREWLRANGNEIGPAAIYFGCRYRARDYIYGEEMEEYLRKGIITELHVAFSRDQSHKIYVQDKIRLNPQVIWDMLAPYNDGYFYFCGPSRNVPMQIRSSIIKAVEMCGKMEPEKAEEYIRSLEARFHYVVEAWS